MKRFLALSAFTFFGVLFTALIASLISAEKPQNKNLNNAVGFGEASGIIASKCGKFDHSVILKGRCMDVYTDAYFSGTDLYSIELDSNANPIANLLPAGVDHYPGEKADTVMSGARPIEGSPSPTANEPTKETRHLKPKKQPH